MNNFILFTFGLHLLCPHKSTTDASPVSKLAESSEIAQKSSRAHPPMAGLPPNMTQLRTDLDLDLLLDDESFSVEVIKASAAVKENDFEARLRSAVKEAQKHEALWQDHMRLFKGSDDQRVKAADGFNCTFIPPSDPVPTSVHELKPGDIKVVAALGDSLTAGFAMEAKTVLGILTEWRGRVWSIGGDDSVDKHATLPNFLRFYNPSLVGFSTGKGMIPSVTKPGSYLNVAVSGSKAQDMPAQAARLIDRIKNFPEPIDFKKDWKLVTILIGANDLCAYNRINYTILLNIIMNS